MASCFVKKKNFVWLLDSNPGVEYFSRINLDTGETVCEYVFRESIAGKTLFSDMILVDDRILLVPLEATQIYIWSIKKRTMMVKEFIPGNVERFESSHTKFANAVMIDNFIYLIPHKYAFMIKLDANSLDIEYIDDFKELVLTEHIGGGGLFERGTGYDGVLYLLCNGSNNICIYDTKDKSYSLAPVGEKDTRLSDLLFDGQYFWVTDNKDRILRMDRTMKKMECILDYRKEGIQKCNNNPVWNKRIAIFGNAIWLFSYAYPVVRINRGTMKHRVVAVEEKAAMLSTGLNHVCIFEDDNKIYALRQCKNVIEEYDDNQVGIKNLYSTVVDDGKVLKEFINMIVKECH